MMRNIYPGASRGYQPYPHPHNSINGINRYPQASHSSLKYSPVISFQISRNDRCFCLLISCIQRVAGLSPQNSAIKYPTIKNKKSRRSAEHRCSVERLEQNYYADIALRKGTWDTLRIDHTSKSFVTVENFLKIVLHRFTYAENRNIR